jgi:hypothetical protein
MVRRYAALAAGALAVCVSAWISCAIPGFEVLETTTSTSSSSGTGGTGGTGTAGSGGAGACQSVVPPGPPAASDPGPDTVDFVAAIRAVDFGETDLADGPRIGYDLDNLCTCSPTVPNGPVDGQSCNVPSWATERCDGPGGRDNAVAQLFELAAAFDQTFDSAAQSLAADQGQWSLLVRVRQYNGMANDDHVLVSLHPSPGLDNDPCLPVNSQPHWDGSDQWPVDSMSLHGSAGGTGVGGCGAAGPGAEGYDIDDPVFFDDNGYVNDGVLVAALPRAGLVFSGNDSAIEMNLVAGYLTATIGGSSSSGWVLTNGLLVGRWKLSDFFLTVRTMTSGGQPLCTDNNVYQMLKTAVCTFPDIHSELSPPTEPCDAMSFAMGFEAEPAQLGFVFVGDVVDIDPCPSATDPANDTCG